ncbi:toprim domain-containing protein [Brevibacillus porteri]|uniref:toprim domain-containing protein n=1 Tax=Brevibacillus porteri TaxID=2126350 RepID=UPI003D202FDE
MRIDVRTELSVVPWTRATWTEDKLLAASPFRFDRTPSFYVWLRDQPITNARAGDWQDYGASDPEYTRGGIVKLLAFIRDETEEETRAYLRIKYGYDGEVSGNVDELTLDLSLTLRAPPEPYKPLDLRMLDEYRTPHPYLSSRGISEDVQRMFGTGYSTRHRAVTIPWYNVEGTLANVKFRRVTEKTFWYVKGGRAIREMIYGLHIVYQRKITRVVLVESEIDAMYLWTAGIPAIAVGGSAFSDEKAELLRKSPIEELRIATDNDEAGAKLKAQVCEKMEGYCELYDAMIPNEYKDMNDVKSSKEVREIVEEAQVHKWSLLFKE